ncbi:MAG: alpha-mannosidase [Eubacteriales bacterium]|nr:alpha-mannosidase [Eubacteriales bacterium]
MFTYEKINVIAEFLKSHIIIESKELDGFVYKESGYKKGNVLPTIDDSFKTFQKGERWGAAKDTHYWFYNKITTYRDDVEFSLKTGREGQWDADNPQFMLYVDGKLVQALDVNHTSYTFEKAGEYEIYLYAYAGMREGLIEFIPTLDYINRKVEQLYYDIKVPLEICDYLDTDDKDYIRILDALNNGVELLDLRKPQSEEFNASVEKAILKIKECLYDKYKNSTDITTICIGHTHIDIAWLWTVKQTREKAVRSFSTVVRLMKQYPEYKFMSSQAVLFKFVKEDAPELYEEIKRLVKEGRFEIEGAMWVEADCNLAGGESLVRQILYGKRFFRQEFGVDCKMLWLPDVFGYSAALPQILLKSGIDRFVTYKISWNESNQMPNDTFMWQGIDGSEIFSYFLTAQDKKRGEKPVRYTTYVADITPAQVAGTWERYSNKLLNNETILTFGYGDGGGGPTKKMLEYARRLEHGIIGCPKAKIDTATNFISRLKQNALGSKHLPKWVGELYLELHRGTYTSIAKNKRKNRKGEFLLKNVELLSSMNMVKGNKKYKQKDINEAWEILMVNQFHDIIPGSSIKEVYDESDASYGKMFDICNSIIQENIEAVKSNIKTDGGVLVFNPNSFADGGVVEVDGKSVYVENIPPMGYKVVKPEEKCDVSVGEKVLENSKIKVVFDEKMQIASIFDKENVREALAGAGNRLIAYEDFPRSWDAWEISNYYVDKSWDIDNVSDVKTIDNGAVKGFEVTRKFQSSTIVQRILLQAYSARVDFDTQIDWNEEHIILKAEFPVDIHANKATYDVQYGTVERPTHQNTSWDAAKFEVCAHKFADLSEPNYGVSLLNDCKYGHDIIGNKMRLTLLKCATYPNPEADKGKHKFVYSVYPHGGDHRTANTAMEGYKLNNPLIAVPVGKQEGTLPDSYSFVAVNKDNIIVEAVKKAEDSGDLIIRLYDNHGIRSDVDVEFGFDAYEVYLADMSENEIEKIECNGNKATLKVKPFEIVTLKVKSIQ